jgi:molybdate transport repressor ModE-like protein
MNFRLDIRWKYLGSDAEEIDPVFFALLKAIRTTGSLRSAAENTNISYRHAWGLIKRWSNRISKPVVTLEKGRGAKLTAIGEKLLWSEQLIISRLSPELQNLSKELNRELNALLDVKSKPEKIRINASHGLAVALLQSLCAESAVFDMDFHFRGSLESLRELANSRCDIAGFHFPAGEISANLAPLYLQWLSEEKHLLLHVSTRQQGLMTTRKNPRKINNLKSLTKRSVRFVNRQPESGTRTIFDELLKREGIKKSSINGYHNEEFTHIAVAALVTSGAADAGFGIKAAASKFGLHFIPIVSETYVLAIDRNIPDKVIEEVKIILKSRKFRNQVNTLPGYDIKQAGEEITFEDLFL